MEDPVILSDRLFERLTASASHSGSDRNVLSDEELDPGLRSFMRDVHDPAYVDRQLAAMNRFDVDAAWKSVSDKAFVGASVVRRPRRASGILLKWLSIAAVMVMLIGIGIYLHRPPVVITPPEISEEIVEAIEKSDACGLSGAMIEKKNYSVRNLVYPKRDKSVPSQPVAEGQSDDSVVDNMLSATKITTYHNKEFWLTLPDGTLVHLGRDTRLIYPDRFDSDVRNVYLEGEGYFIVAKSPDSRFVVHTSAGATTVYGTEFNVSTPSDSVCCVVLVKGSVGVATSTGSQLMLTPGEEAVMSDGSITVSEVDVTPYTAWNTGRIDFTGWNLGKVMSVIGKWYDKDVRFGQEDFSAIEITGSFNRYETLRPTLEALSIITGLDITSDSDSIYVNK